jgi:anti-sigma B factor antagonist
MLTNAYLYAYRKTLGRLHNSEVTGMKGDFRRNGHHDPRGSALECRIELVSDCSVVHVCGEVDLATVHLLNKALDAALSASRPIIVSFAKATYIDSAGIHALLLAKRRHQTTIAAAALAPTLKKIFELTGIDEIIPLYDTLDVALSTLCVPSASGGTSA